MKTIQHSHNLIIVAFLTTCSLFSIANGRGQSPTVKERNWGKTVKRFNLHGHLQAPTSRDLREGADGSRRLARNAMRLGVDEEHHRHLIPANPPGGIIEDFDQVSEASSPFINSQWTP